MPNDLSLSAKQQAIFDAISSGAHRVTLVSAGPGSGKTRLFVRTMEYWLSNPPPRPGGIAALSFTNAANDVIGSRLDSVVSAPHFLGTLDSFMLRFVVRPFAHLLGANAAGLRLIPEQSAANLNDRYLRAYGPNPQDKAGAFSVGYVGGTEDSPEITVAGPAAYSKRIVVPQAYAGSFIQAKRAEWAGYGRITHADTHYLAAKILCDPAHGSQVRSLLASRFPVLLVDELQDTSHFLGRALLALLEGCSSAFLVGDQDQGIYEFAGADAAALFSSILKLDDADLQELKTSHRCPSLICEVASMLAVSGARVDPEDVGSKGQIILLRHNLATTQPDAALLAEIDSLCGTGDETLIVLARRSSTVARLEGRPAGADFKNCPFAKRMLKALARFRDEGSRALADIEGLAFESCYADKKLSASSMCDLGLDPLLWHRSTRKYTASALTFLATEPTWNEWVAFLKTASKELEAALPGASLGVRFRADNNNGAKRVAIARSPGAGHKLEVSTVHQAKGREYDNVVYFFPKPHSSNAPCPSVSWFTDRSGEETRTAFVAATRTKQRFILALHEQSILALELAAPEFVKLFERPGGTNPSGATATSTPGVGV